MIIDAVAVSSSDFTKTKEFYTILGFTFPDTLEHEDHLEAIRQDGSARLMIDSTKLMKDLIGETPVPSNHATFAIKYDTPDEIDAVATKLSEAGFSIVKAPWKAFWGQYYCAVADPDSYNIDLFANL